MSCLLELRQSQCSPSTGLVLGEPVPCAGARALWGYRAGQEPLALHRDPAEQLPAWLQGNLQLLVAKFCHVSPCGESNRGARVPRPLPRNAVTVAGRRVSLLGQVCAPAPSLGARCLSEHGMAGQGRRTREPGFTWLKYHHISLILDFS